MEAFVCDVISGAFAFADLELEDGCFDRVEASTWASLASTLRVTQGDRWPEHRECRYNQHDHLAMQRSHET